jgi:general secretion pathway protein D
MGTLRPNYVVLALLALVSGCASYQNIKGKAEIALDKPDDGVQSLSSAAKLDPLNPRFQADYLSQRDKHAADVVALADELRALGKHAEAKTAYERILKLDPGNLRAEQGLRGLMQDARNEKLLSEGEALLAQGRADLALERAAQVLDTNGKNKRALMLREASLDARNDQQLAIERARLARTILDAPVTLQFRDAPLRIVFESLSKSTGLNVLMDRDVRQDTRVTVFVRDVTVGDALDLILLQNQLDKRVLNGNTVLVYPATATKQAEYEDLVIRSFRVTNADIRYLSNMLKVMLKLREVAADERSGVLVLRDTAERLRLAERLIALHDAPDPEVMLEVQVLEVTSERRSKLGLEPPSALTIATPGSAGSLTWGVLRDMTRNDLLVSPISATLNFKLEDSDTRILASPRIRAKNKEKARIMIGDRVPTVTNTVTPVATGTPVVTGNVTYQDVGLKLEFEPQVYANSEVGIKISLEVSNIAQAFTDPQGGRSYQIGTRNANTVLRLKDGETQVLGGLISDQDRSVASKIPGLGHLPVVGRLFGSNDGTDTRSEIVLAITPRIVRDVPAGTPESRSMFSGTANLVRERPILADPVKELRVTGPVGGQAGQPIAPTGPAAMPPVSGQTTPQGQVMFNPAPTQQTPSIAPTMPGAAPGLPAPPPMINRQPINR